ncbi:hypothetical protein D9Q81_00640 [Candidatus Korarchaeum cryptofilum]|uniref:Uncharacterized protein n=1 Tax=Candidatus Korarchaeum cryptofilum TaxID=498846 RepID=A0A3R9QT87_9CREN|nr:hypothetical protein D9Q81_00640 [Candidatus Korarchaeum cryptofilum]
MKNKKVIVLITIICLLIGICAFYRFFFVEKNKIVNIPEDEREEFFLRARIECPFEDNYYNYSICCIEGENKSSCTDSPYLKCGEAIVVEIKMNFTNENYRLCANRNLFVDESKKDFPKKPLIFMTMMRKYFLVTMKFHSLEFFSTTDSYRTRLVSLRSNYTPFQKSWDSMKSSFSTKFLWERRF